MGASHYAFARWKGNGFSGSVSALQRLRICGVCVDLFDLSGSFFIVAMALGKAMGMRGMCLVYRMTAAKVSRKRSVVPPYLKQKHLIIPVYTQNSNSPSQGIVFRMWPSRTGWVSFAFMDFHIDFHMAPPILRKKGLWWEGPWRCRRLKCRRKPRAGYLAPALVLGTLTPWSQVGKPLVLFFPRGLIKNLFYLSHLARQSPFLSLQSLSWDFPPCNIPDSLSTLYHGPNISHSNSTRVRPKVSRHSV